MSQPELAEASGVPVGTIRSIEQGRRVPGLFTLLMLSKAMNVSMGGWEDAEPNEDE